MSQPKNYRTQEEEEATWPRIDALWKEARAEYQRMFAAVLPSLPVGARTFFEKVQLHDAKVLSVTTESNDTLTMVFDTTGSYLPGERFRVSFQGVTHAEGLAGLEGEWWVYEEVHSSDVAAFDLQVLCEQTEFRIVANDISYAAIGERKKKQRHCDCYSKLSIDGEERQEPPTMKLTDAYTFRPATNDDLLAIRAVLFSVRCEFGVVDETGKSDRDLNDLAKKYSEGGGMFEVIVDRCSNRIVGCAGLRPRSRRRAELCKMYILKSARGRGLGKRLLEDLLEVARRGGFAEVWLETNSTLTVATSLYEKYGFQPVAPDDLRPRCDQAYLFRLT